MERIVEKLDGSHNRMTLVMQGTVERDAWSRTFPNPMPSTHRLAYKWDETGMRIIVEPVLIDKVETAGKVPEAPAVPNDMPEAELTTLAAERGVKIKAGMSRAQIVAAIAEKNGRG